MERKRLNELIAQQREYVDIIRGLGEAGKIAENTLDALKTLGDYLDTGLTPEQIREIDKVYKKICKYVNSLEGKTARLIDADNMQIPPDAPYKASVKRTVEQQPTVAEVVRVSADEYIISKNVNKR